MVCLGQSAGRASLAGHIRLVFDTGLMESEMALHEEHFVEAIKNNPRVKRVVFTGHSLGGGLAAVAPLFALGSWAKDVPQVEEWRTLAFEGPAVFTSTRRTPTHSPRTS